jgi:hypothetical protein
VDHTHWVARILAEDAIAFAPKLEALSCDSTQTTVVTALVTFSVVVPTFGRPQFLSDAIASVLRQSVDDFEVVVVDDCSPVPVVLPEDSRVRLVRADVNGGAGAARNLGAEAAIGEVLTFLDDDDTWTPSRLRYAASALERAPVAVCWQSPDSGRRLEGDVFDSILDATTPNMGATAIRRKAWVPMDPTYRACQDIVWWLDVAARQDVATHAAQGLVYRKHSGIRSGYGTDQRIRESLRLLHERAAYFDEHPRAAAFRWKRIGRMHWSLGQRREARSAFYRAWRLRPNLADFGHLIRLPRP